MKMALAIGLGRDSSFGLGCLTQSAACQSAKDRGPQIDGREFSVRQTAFGIKLVTVDGAEMRLLACA